MFEKIKEYLYWRKDPTGKLFYLNKFPGLKIGENCSFIGKNISFSSEPYLIKLGNDVRVSCDVLFVTHDGGTFIFRKENPDICIYGSIEIGNNVFIGARAIILPNVKIGDNCIIGAGSIVTHDINDNTIAAGIPAKTICTTEEYLIKNKDFFTYILNRSYLEKKEYLLNNKTANL